jgi:hypothetical protein
MKIELNEKQARTMVEALDLYSRILIGQFEDVGRLAITYNVTFGDKSDYESFHEFSDRIRELKEELLKIPQNASFGIYNESVHNNARVAWDMQQVIRHNLAWKRTPEGGHTVDFVKPHKSSTTEEELIKILE